MSYQTVGTMPYLSVYLRTWHIHRLKVLMGLHKHLVMFNGSSTPCGQACHRVGEPGSDKYESKTVEDKFITKGHEVMFCYE